MNVTTIELLDLLAHHARDPDASPEERAFNAAELARLLKHHDLAEAHLTPPELLKEGEPEWRAFDPAPATVAERLLAIHLTCAGPEGDRRQRPRGRGGPGGAGHSGAVAGA